MKSLDRRYPKDERKARNIQWQNIAPVLEERTKIAQIPERPGTIQIFPPKGSSVTDADAALGWARSWKPTFPFKMGVFDDMAQKGLIDRTLNTGDIKPGGYNLYLLGSSSLTADCYVWTAGFFEKSCVRAYDRNSPAQSFDIYISLKFEGPRYGTNTPEDRVLCDRIVFVKKAH